MFAKGDRSPLCARRQNRSARVEKTIQSLESAREKISEQPPSRRMCHSGRCCRSAIARRLSMTAPGDFSTIVGRQRAVWPQPSPGGRVVVGGTIQTFDVVIIEAGTAVRENFVLLDDSVSPIKLGIPIIVVPAGATVIKTVAGASLGTILASCYTYSGRDKYFIYKNRLPHYYLHEGSEYPSARTGLIK